jgi:hypothetical protein
MTNSLWSRREYFFQERGRDCILRVGGNSRWGDAYHVPACPFNLISDRTLMDLGFGVQWDRDSIITTSPSGDRLSFEFDNSCGLYVSDAVVSSPVLVANHFTTEQRKRAKMVRELHERLNHASDDQMASLLDFSCPLDTPLTAKDVCTTLALRESS